MKTTKWMTMAAVVTLSASLAFAAPHPGGKRGGKFGRHGGQHFGERMAEKLNLTDAQQQQIRELNKSFRESNKAFFENTRETRKQLRAAKEAGDTAKVESLKPSLEAQRTQMKQLHDAQQQRILAVLTPQQRTQWEALKAERQKRRAERGPRGNRN
jgi:periplasmic protein CpxP/Spy